jgi:CBS domain-containing protein
MEKVSTILERRHRYFNTTSPTCMVSDALYKMCFENVDHLIVMENEKYVGIISEHDVTSKLMFINQPLNKIYVKDVMNTGLPVSNTTDTIEHVMLQMRQHNIRYLPVFEGINFKGIITSDDIIQEAVFNRLEIFDDERERPTAYA